MRAGLLWLLREASLAMVLPRRVFRRIPPGARMAYGRVLPLMALWGIPYAQLHFRAMEGIWMASRMPQETVIWRTLTFIGGSVANWLMAAVVLGACSAWRRWPLSLRQCEVAAFYLWFVWALMPIVDVVHWWGLPVRNFPLLLPSGRAISFLGHASWLVAFPLLCLELAVLLHRSLGFSRWGAVVLAVGGVGLGRGLFEALSYFSAARLEQRGVLLSMWQVNTLHAALGIGQWLAVRVWLGGRRRWLAAVVAVALGFLGFGLLF